MKEGIYGKYILSKADGSDVDPEACYFVLRLDTDDAAIEAMRTYAKHCDNVTLAEEILECIVEIETPPCGCREAHCGHDKWFPMRWQHGGNGAVVSQQSSGTGEAEKDKP